MNASAGASRTLVVHAQPARLQSVRADEERDAVRQIDSKMRGQAERKLCELYPPRKFQIACCMTMVCMRLCVLGEGYSWSILLV